MEKVGLFAGVGKLPVEFMRAAQQLGHEVVVIAVVDGVAPELQAEADTYYAINVAKLDKIIKTMRKEGVTKVTMIGKVTKEILFKGLKFPTAKAMGGMDIGQTVVVKHKAVMAVEAIEGTDACIHRGGMLGREKAVVVKVAKPNQDVRFDVPAVGLTTIQSMIESGCTVLAMEAGRTLFVEQDDVLKTANAHHICICAVDKTF